MVRVANLGNGPGTPSFPTDLTVEPTPAQQAPGETVLYRLRTVGRSGEVALPGNQVPVAVAVRTPDRAVELVRWEIVPALGVAPGQTVTAQIVLRNAGDSPLAGVPVRVFADGQLVSAGKASGPAGEEARLDLAWRAAYHNQVIVVTVGQAGNETAGSMLLQVDPSLHHSPAVTALVFVALACAAWSRRRRA
jgi:hypothetical protein